MPEMRTISWSGKRGARKLHIEAPGCIVNITKNLHDREGRQVTRVDVRADQYAGDTPWVLPETGSGDFIGVRVVENNPPVRTAAYTIDAEDIERLRDLANFFNERKQIDAQLAILDKVTGRKSA